MTNAQIEAQVNHLFAIRCGLNLFKDGYSQLSGSLLEADFDINDFISKDYPLERSFDELAGSIHTWVSTSIQSIDLRIHILEYQNVNPGYILEENGWENLTGEEVQILLGMCSQADKDRKTVIQYKGKDMLVAFGYEIVRRLGTN